MVSGCPEDLDERMELYCLDRLQIQEAQAFERHVAVCPACFYEVLGTDMFLESLMVALIETESEEENQIGRE